MKVITICLFLVGVQAVNHVKVKSDNMDIGVAGKVFDVLLDKVLNSPDMREKIGLNKEDLDGEVTVNLSPE